MTSFQRIVFEPSLTQMRKIFDLKSWTHFHSWKIILIVIVLIDNNVLIDLITCNKCVNSERAAMTSFQRVVFKGAPNKDSDHDPGG